MKILFKMKSGSHLYGLTTPTSDIDYVGVYIEDTLEEVLNPFNTQDEMDLSVKSKLENGKNDKDAIDEKYFHLKKFLKLCAECNPNIIEMLFAPEDCIEYVDETFKGYFLDHPEMFVNKKIIDRFIGYAKSQEQKSYTKSENYLELNKFKSALEQTLSNSNWSKLAKLIMIMRKDTAKHLPVYEYINSYKTVEHTKSNIEKVYTIGNMEFPSGLSIKDTIDRINDRLTRASHRIDSIFINKYEPKFMSHTVRLLAEGIELLSTGKIVFPLSGQVKEDIMNIKLGLTNVEDIPNIVNGYKDTLNDLETTNSNLIPDKPDYDSISKAYHGLIMSLFIV